MASTLAPGQHVLVDRMAFRLHLIDRGDVIVWRDPQSPHELALRRVVALPGDLLVWRADLLFVNGVQTAVQISDLGTGSEAAAFRATGVGMAALRSAVHPYRVSAGTTRRCREWRRLRRGRLLGDRGAPDYRRRVLLT